MNNPIVENSAIKMLEAWFASRCNGDWEHQGGITIETLDNPGWYITVPTVNYYGMMDAGIERRSFERSETDFVSIKIKKETLIITCGVKNLEDCIKILMAYQMPVDESGE